MVLLFELELYFIKAIDLVFGLNLDFCRLTIFMRL